jgi:hypothetical protein
MKLRKAALQRIKELEFQLHRARLSLKGDSFSKLNEQQLLRKYIQELLPADHDHTVVDIGAGDGIRMSNSYALFTDGWRGVGVEFDPRKAARLANAYKFYEDVSVCRCQVTPENINPLFAAFNIPKDFSILSLDIDSYDLPVLDAILSSYRPRIVVTEINEKIPPPIRFYVKFDPALRLHHHFYGYSIKTLEDLCAARDYAIIDLEYNNAFIAPKELAIGRELSAEEAYHKGYLDRPDRREKFRPNENMEVLHSMSPREGVEFLNDFYIRDQGNYEISVDEVIGVASADNS